MFFVKIVYINSANFIYIAGHSANSVAMMSPQYWSESHRGSDKKLHRKLVVLKRCWVDFQPYYINTDNTKCI